MDRRRILIRSAIAALVAAAASPALAEEKSTANKEKCYGIAKAGHNDCASPSGNHSCAGQAKTDNSANEWKFVAKGTCDKAGGKLAAPAK
jgi:uncharacterized membrane protein